MQRATGDVKAWCRANSTLQLPRRWHISKTKLSLKSGKYVHYIGKGFHVSILLGFLQAFLANKVVDSDLKMLVWSGDTLMSFLHDRRKDGLLLSERDVRQVLVLGEYHLNQLLLVNRKFSGWPTYRLFNIRPKFHAMAHILEFAESRRNPVSQSCWMEEDWIRGVANLAKKTHARTTPLSTLQRYSAGQWFVQMCISVTLFYPKSTVPFAGPKYLLQQAQVASPLFWYCRFNVLLKTLLSKYNVLSCSPCICATCQLSILILPGGEADWCELLCTVRMR